MQEIRHPSLLGLIIVGLVACSGGSPGNSTPDSTGDSANSGMPTGFTPVTPTVANIDRSCDDVAYPSAEWTNCENQNLQRAQSASADTVMPSFAARRNEQSNQNTQDWTARVAADASWLAPQSGNSVILPLCTTWGLSCAGDPFRYPGYDGPDGDDFYNGEAEVEPVVFYDNECARLSGRVWRPRDATGRLPAVVIQNGSVQAPEPLYWWAAQLLVRNGYVVMTFDPRGQGRSDQQTPTGEQGSNSNPTVFWEGLVDAIDFFRSSANQPYPHNSTCAATYPTATTASNPFIDSIDPDRLGIAGHSLGGVGVTVVQSYDGAGADPWPGVLDNTNPVKVVVAWDGIFNPDTGAAGNAGGNTGDQGGTNDSTPTTVPRVPIMGQNGEYGLTPIAFTEPPDPDRLIASFRRWQAAAIPVVELNVRGSTHYEWSLLAEFPTSSWCPNSAEGFCNGGLGNAFAQHHTLAWFDRWLKLPGEAGYADADQRLLDDGGENGADKLSFRYRSARDFPDRSGTQQRCEDIRAGC